MQNKSWSMALYPCMRKYKWKLTAQLPRGLVISLIDIDSDTQNVLWRCQQKSMMPSLLNKGITTIPLKK